ncbi:hypothetical protein V8C86DRAFT_2767494 [Haematococcus lacustris]
MAQAALAHAGMFQGPRFARVRRHHLLSDGFTQLASLTAEQLKTRVRVQFVDEEGLAEAGIDGGGLFKDFMEGLMRDGFGGDSGLFVANSQRELYPAPSAAFSPVTRMLLRFLGAMLGKALWEGLLLELPLARFFLKSMRGGKCDLHDLPSLDEQLYRNLLSLRQHPEGVVDLSLTFCAVSDVRGQRVEVELKPGGKDIPVTADNLEEYIARVADFRLNVELRQAVEAFMQGFHDLIDPEWVVMFNEHEMQTLISGRVDSAGQGLDLEDMRAHTHYQSGYHEEHPVVAVFWSVLAAFTPDQQRAFLKFVTACSRPPLLGFRFLEPQLCIQMAGGVLDPAATDRLPTAATCMNLLKLPPYQKATLMREKLLLAITGTEGFDLS